jgi:hypothetical protein
MTITPTPLTVSTRLTSAEQEYVREAIVRWQENPTPNAAVEEWIEQWPHLVSDDYL